jgi:hypothetical protein
VKIRPMDANATLVTRLFHVSPSSQRVGTKSPGDVVLTKTAAPQLGTTSRSAPASVQTSQYEQIARPSFSRTVVPRYCVSRHSHASVPGGALPEGPTARCRRMHSGLPRRQGTALRDATRRCRHVFRSLQACALHSFLPTDAWQKRMVKNLNYFNWRAVRWTRRAEWATVS